VFRSEVREPGRPEMPGKKKKGQEKEVGGTYFLLPECNGFRKTPGNITIRQLRIKEGNCLKNR
jgi:hypothetical protein